MSGALVLVLDNYHLLSGRESGLTNQLPWLVLVAAGAGYVVGSVRPVRTPVNVLGDVGAPPVDSARVNVADK